MKNLEINVFGELQILVDDVDISQTIWASKKKMALLELLILNSQRPMSIARLTEAIWGDDEEINTENALKTLVSRLRKDLEENGLEGAILTVPGGYMWNADLPCQDRCVSHGGNMQCLIGCEFSRSRCEGSV